MDKDSDPFGDIKVLNSATGHILYVFTCLRSVTDNTALRDFG